MFWPENDEEALVSSKVPEITLKIITYLTGVTQRKEELKIKNLLLVATSKDLAATQLSDQRVMIRWDLTPLNTKSKAWIKWLTPGFDPYFGRTGSSLSTFGRGRVVYVSTSPIHRERRY
ncbi:hypothetical protein Tco_0618385 [Tanacetum coccineum]